MRGSALYSATMSRRRLGRLLAGTGLCAATIALSPARTRAGGLPVLYTWEGFDSPALVGDFPANHGGMPIFQTFTDENEAFENLKAGLTVDLAHPCADTFGHWHEAGLLQPIDTGRLTNWRHSARRLPSPSARVIIARSCQSSPPFFPPPEKAPGSASRSARRPSWS